MLAGLCDAGGDRKSKKAHASCNCGIGSDHVDLEAAIKNGITVAEVTYSNSISVSEHVVTVILASKRNSASPFTRPSRITLVSGVRCGRYRAPRYMDLLRDKSRAFGKTNCKLVADPFGPLCLKIHCSFI